MSANNNQQVQGGGKGKSGCFIIGMVGCVTFLLVAAIGGYYMAIKAREFAYDAVATMSETLAEEMMKEMKLPEAEHEAAMVPVREFADRIRAGKVTMEEGEQIGKRLNEGPLPAIIMSRAFELRYLEKSELPEAEKESGHVTVTRFAEGLASDRISAEDRQAVMDVVMVETVGRDGTTEKKIKSELTEEELARALELMDTAADNAGVEEREFRIDLAEEIRRVLTPDSNADNQATE